MSFLPRKLASLTGSPVNEGRVKSGAGCPTCTLSLAGSDLSCCMLIVCAPANSCDRTCYIKREKFHFLRCLSWKKRGITARYCLHCHDGETNAVRMFQLQIGSCLRLLAGASRTLPRIRSNL